MRVRVRLHLGYGKSIKVEEFVVGVAEVATLADLWQAIAAQQARLVDIPLLNPNDEPAELEQSFPPFARGAALTILEVESEPGEASFDVQGIAPGTYATPAVVDGFDFPVGKPDASRYYIAAGVAEQPYRDKFGFWHTGEDWNGTGGGDSDLGDPVYATAHGRVIAASFFAPSWGNIVLIEHQLPGERKVWSQYAHLRERLVREGDLVRRGQAIGTIGKGHNNQWPAHLHFEIRFKEMPPNQWGWVSHQDRQKVLQYYAHPSDWIRSNRPGHALDTRTVDDLDPGFVRTGSRYWFEARVGYRDRSWWTWAVDAQKGEDCVGVWRPRLRVSGLYEVFAFIPRDFATTRNAEYRVTHRRGTTTVPIVQADFYDEWVSLGRFAFATDQPASVRLSDLTGEPYTSDEKGRRQVAYDAIQWVLVQ